MIISSLIALILFAVLAVVSAFHAYWGIGGVWPASDEPTLARTVIGSKGVTSMPPSWLTLSVAAFILLAGIIPLASAGLVPGLLPSWMITMGMGVLTFIFLVRGVAGYLPFFRDSQVEEPFATLDRTYFSPLCIALGLGFAILLLTAGQS